MEKQVDSLRQSVLNRGLTNTFNKSEREVSV